MNRRSLLSITGSALTLALGGCISDSEPVSQQTETTVETSQTPRSSTTTTETGTPKVEPISRLGGGSPVELSVQPEREYEYLETEDKVRVRYDHGSDTTPFGEWGTLRATEHASRYVKTTLQEQSLLKTGVSVGMGIVKLDELTETSGEKPVESEFNRDREIGPIVSHMHHYSRDGTLLSSPAVSFDTLVKATPRTMEVTMEFPERDYTAILPVLCRKGWYQND
ncbi:hypothetical protein [Haloferax elongans]|nr:hypothetical protein [Haloferax elongans]